MITTYMKTKLVDSLISAKEYYPNLSLAEQGRKAAHLFWSSLAREEQKACSLSEIESFLRSLG